MNKSKDLEKLADGKGFDPIVPKPKPKPKTKPKTKGK